MLSSPILNFESLGYFLGLSSLYNLQDKKYFKWKKSQYRWELNVPEKWD